jgi:hypothetical protein
MGQAGCTARAIDVVLSIAGTNSREFGRCSIPITECLIPTMGAWRAANVNPSGAPCGWTPAISKLTLSPFYLRRDDILQRAKFDFYAERLGRKFYAPTIGRPRLRPGAFYLLSGGLLRRD